MTALQPLTDTQVQNRLEAYNAGGALERDIRALWDDAGEIIESRVRASSSASRGWRSSSATIPSPVDAGWVQDVAEYRPPPLSREAVGPGLYRHARQADQRHHRPAVRKIRRRARPGCCECVTSLQRLTSL